MLTYAYELHGAPETYLEGDVNRISGQLVSHLESEMDYDQGWELIHNESCICLPDTIDDLVLDDDDEYVYECHGCDNPDYGNNKTYYREYVLYFEDTYGKDVKAVLATQRYTDSGSDWSDIEPNSAKLQLFYEGPNHQDCATRAEEFTVDQSDYSDFGSGGNEVWRQIYNRLSKRRSLILNFVENTEPPGYEYSLYDPTVYGYFISRIESDNQVRTQMYDDNVGTVTDAFWLGLVELLQMERNIQIAAVLTDRVIDITPESSVKTPRGLNPAV